MENINTPKFSLIISMFNSLNAKRTFFLHLIKKYAQFKILYLKNPWFNLVQIVTQCKQDYSVNLITFNVPSKKLLLSREFFPALSGKKM